MRRIDPVCRSLHEGLEAKDLAVDVRADLKARLEQREKQLLPVYHQVRVGCMRACGERPPPSHARLTGWRAGGGTMQVAVQFADLHDTAGRMKEKNVIRAVVDWANARRYFGERLRRRMAEEAVLRLAARQAPSIPRARVHALLREWFDHDVPGGEWARDTVVADWLARADVEVRAHVQALEREHITATMVREGERDKAAAVAALLTLAKTMDAHERSDLVAKLKAL
jgi:acetyl-CoA carboxylase / biotin carboxylase 1